MPLWRGLARRSDPETSKLAAEGVVLDGTVQRSKALALNAVRNHPGQTARELAERIGVRSIHRRLTELDRDGGCEATVVEPRHARAQHGTQHDDAKHKTT